MSRLNDLLRQLDTKDPALAADLRREVDALADRRAFGLNFERHVPEAVELPGRTVRKGDKVRVLPPRGQTRQAENDILWRVMAITTGDGGVQTAQLELLDGSDQSSARTDDLVVVAEFRDPIYPGLVSTGKVERGGDKPYHTVINAENFHALQTLLYTHRGKVDCIYIDPPYNSGTRDWKYNDDYVEGDDLYRHSKWLAFMERRLRLARELLAKTGFLLISIDDREQARLKLLCDQIFGAGSMTATFVWRTDGNIDNQALIKTNHEYVLMYSRSPGAATITGQIDPNVDESSKLFNTEIRNSVVKNGPKNPMSSIVLEPGFPATFAEGVIPSRADKYPMYDSDLTVRDGVLQNRVTATTGWANGRMLRQFIETGYSPLTDSKGQETVFELTQTGAIENVKKRRDGQHHILTVLMNMGTVETAGNALRDLGVEFPYPKPVYLIRYLTSLAPHDAVVLDFFAGSGTTVEAVARLNALDGGTRRAIAITNNEVASSTEVALRDKGVRRGDPQWNAAGVHDAVTRPRIRAAFTGHHADDTKATSGIAQNVEFFTLTYEAPLRVSSNREFAKVAPLLWLRAGSRGRRIEDVSTGWDVADVYGVLVDLDQSEQFVKTVSANEQVSMAFIVTDEDRLFQALVRELPDHVDCVRLYESYLRNFEIESGRSVR